MDAASLVRAHIRAMPAYEPILPYEVLSAQLGLPVDCLVKLDANENPYGPLPAVRQALADLPYVHIYPDPESRELRTALALYLNVPVENLLVGAGADELIDLMIRLVIEPGDGLVDCPPTFGMYSFDGDLNGARLWKVPRRPDFSVDVAAITRLVAREHPRLVFIAAPNNPDGSLLDEVAFEQLLDLPVLVVLDEAYVEFALPGASRIQQVARRENLIVLRTFSKWAGLAGLRVGYGAFPAALMPALWKIKQPYNVSAAASTAALVSLQHADELQAVGARLLSERQRLMQALRRFAWLQPYPSQANFILCRVLGRSGRQLKNDLAQGGVLVRYFDKPGLQDHIRISVGRPQDTDRLIEKLQEVQNA